MAAVGRVRWLSAAIVVGGAAFVAVSACGGRVAVDPPDAASGGVAPQLGAGGSMMPRGDVGGGAGNSGPSIGGSGGGSANGGSSHRDPTGGAPAGGGAGRGGSGGGNGGSEGCNGAGACNPAFCPNVGTGVPCCQLPCGPCGIDVGCGCLPTTMAQVIGPQTTTDAPRCREEYCPTGDGVKCCVTPTGPCGFDYGAGCVDTYGPPPRLLYGGVGYGGTSGWIPTCPDAGSDAAPPPLVDAAADVSM